VIRTRITLLALVAMAPPAAPPPPPPAPAQPVKNTPPEPGFVAQTKVATVIEPPRPRPPAALPVSTTSIRRPECSRSASAAAWRPDSTVPEMPPEMCSETMSRPASSSGS